MAIGDKLSIKKCTKPWKFRIWYESLGLRASVPALGRPITPCFVDAFALAPIGARPEYGKGSQYWDGGSQSRINCTDAHAQNPTVVNRLKASHKHPIRVRQIKENNLTRLKRASTRYMSKLNREIFKRDQGNTPLSRTVKIKTRFPPLPPPNQKKKKTHQLKNVCCGLA